MALIPYAGKEVNGGRSKEAQGFYERSPRPKISVIFPQDDFDKMLMMAQKKNVPFASVVRELVSSALRQRRL